MIKTFFKLLLCILVYTIVRIIAMILLPSSQELMELSSAMDPLSMVMFLPISSAFVCFTMFFIIRHTYFGGVKLFLNIIYVMFFVSIFTQHIDTLFIGSAFPAMTRLDIAFTMLSGLFSLLATVPLMIYFFQNKSNVIENIKQNIKSLIPKLGIFGVIYLIIYGLFGFLFIFSVEEFRLFYSSIEINPLMLILFQLLRGILLGIFIIPLKNMIKTKNIFIISVCLVYLCMAVDLIMPNPLLYTKLRMFHLMEMATSMILFGIIVSNILWRK